MREIVLSNGGTALVDDEDYPLLARHNWCSSHGYAVTWVKTESGKGANVRMERFIMPASVLVRLDHRDGNKCNNQKHNLRTATAQENAHNSRARKGTSKYKGVSLRLGRSGVKGKPWTAVITYNGKQQWIGAFADERTAALAYDAKAKELFGEYAWLNAEHFPELKEAA